jgi:hypothetical protein
VVTIASLIQPHPDLLSQEYAGGNGCNEKLIQAGRRLVLHGKEKVYGSIP